MEKFLVRVRQDESQSPNWMSIILYSKKNFTLMYIINEKAFTLLLSGAYNIQKSQGITKSKTNENKDQRPTVRYYRYLKCLIST
jgi:hypothetical protein